MALYYARAGHENSLARANEELGLRDTFSEKLPGQDVTVQVGLLVWNLAIELGAKLAGLPQSPAGPPAQRAPRVACRRQWGVDEPVAAPALPASQPDADPPRADGPTAPAPAAAATVAALPVEPVAAPVAPQPPAAPAEPGVLPDPIPPVGPRPAGPVAPTPGAAPAEVRSALATGPQPVALPAPTAAVSPDDNGKRAAIEAWLTQRPGWSWDEDRGLLCPAGHALCLRRRKLLPDEQEWFFRAKANTCPTCPQRSGGTCSTLPAFRRQAVLRIPLGIPTPGAGPGRPAQLTHPAPLLPVLAALVVASPVSVVPTSPSTAWTPPLPSEPGPLEVSYPALVPAVLRRELYTACETVVVRVEVKRPAPPPEPLRHLVPTRSAHQHRRHTWAERRAWNALPPGTQVRVEFLGGAAIWALLNDDQPASKAA